MTARLANGRQSPSRDSLTSQHRVACERGHVWFLSTAYAQGELAAGRPLRCKQCARNRARRAWGERNPAHRGLRPRQDTPHPRLCGACMGLPWRRARAHCAGCGEAYQAEPAVTVVDVMSNPVANPRVA